MQEKFAQTSQKLVKKKTDKIKNDAIALINARNVLQTLTEKLVQEKSD